MDRIPMTLDLFNELKGISFGDRENGYGNDTVSTLREELAFKYYNSLYLEATENNDTWIRDKSGCRMVEVIGASFIADEDHIFGAPNHDYIGREIEWYRSMSRYVADIPGNTPEIWEQVSSNEGMINSNYGWCIFSEENGHQYLNVLKTLKNSPDSRQAVMIYTRPTMHTDAFSDGMHDFMCTNAVQYVIRNNRLHAIVQMRSNDAWAGYRNDWAWQKYVQNVLSQELNTTCGNIYWNAGSMHVYERNFPLIHNYLLTGNSS